MLLNRDTIEWGVVIVRKDGREFLFELIRSQPYKDRTDLLTQFTHSSLASKTVERRETQLRNL